MLLVFIFKPTIETAEQVPVAHNGGGAHPAPRRTCLSMVNFNGQFGPATQPRIDPPTTYDLLRCFQRESDRICKTRNIGNW